MDFDRIKEGLSDELAERLQDIYDAAGDIVVSESISFKDKWSDYFITAPVLFLNAESIIAHLIEQVPELIGQWNTRVTPSDELSEALGILSDASEYIVDYINFSRKVNILQYINAYTGLGLLDIFLDTNGQETIKIVEDSDSLIDLLFDDREAIDKYLHDLILAKKDFEGV